MALPTTLQSIPCGTHNIELFVPNPAEVEKRYRQQMQEDAATPFPYWTQIWPAALSMIQFLVQHTHYIQNKKVLELAAGLGLQSLLAAKYATEVCCSDYLPEAILVMQKSVQHNQLRNMYCMLADWNHLPPELTADTLLLSDINYDPAAFEILYAVIQYFLDKCTTIILSTPQRLMAKPFIDRLTPWCIQQQEITVMHAKQPVLTMVMVLKKNQ